MEKNQKDSNGPMDQRNQKDLSGQRDQKDQRTGSSYTPSSKTSMGNLKNESSTDKSRVEKQPDLKQGDKAGLKPDKGAGKRGDTDTVNRK